MNVVFIMNEYSLHNHVVETWMEERPGDAVAIVKVPLVLKGKGRRETAGRIVPQLSRRFAWGKMVEFFVMLAITLVPKVMPRGPVFRRLRRIARRNGLPFHKTANVMSPETLAFVRDQSPDVVVSLFHQIVKPGLVEIPRFGVVNVHPGVLPDFRGIQPYFWELSEGAERSGATLHLIEDAGIDTGRVIGQTTFDVVPGMSVQLNYWLTCRAAGRLLPRCVAAWVAGEIEPVVQDPEAGAYWRWPDSAAFDRLKARGHPLLSWRQLFLILSGRHDGPPLTDS